MNTLKHVDPKSYLCELDRQRDLIEHLRSPICFPHSIDKIEIIETHISWVILTGIYAYKIKKSVNFGFLDFSSLGLRRYFCEEEVRLNTHFSDFVYLDVVPITGTIENPEINGQGEAIEYAVLMREFDRGKLLSDLAQRSEIDSHLLVDVANQLALFHERARTWMVSEREYLSAVTSSTKNNFQQILALGVYTPEEEALLEKIRDWSESKLKSLQSYFKERYQNGFVRDCHGDLHLSNITVINDRPVFFDCIEFNPSFRNIDTLSELAFLAMDLEFMGLHEQANILVNQYLATTGDYKGLKVFQFYKVYRAMVRAKVCRLKIQQQTPGESKNLNMYAQYMKYLMLAGCYIRQHAVTLAISHGFSGSGKTTQCRQLAKDIGAIHIRSDVERKRLYGLRAEESSRSALNRGIYTAKATERTYESLLITAANIVEAGYSVIVDATFLKKLRRDAFRLLAEDKGIRFKILHCQASDSQIKRHLREREMERQRNQGSVSEAGISVFANQKTEIDALTALEKTFELSLDDPEWVRC